MICNAIFISIVFFNFFGFGNFLNLSFNNLMFDKLINISLPHFREDLFYIRIRRPMWYHTFFYNRSDYQQYFTVRN